MALKEFVGGDTKMNNVNMVYKQQTAAPVGMNALQTDYLRIRKQSETLCEPLEIEDYGIQSMDATSPPKWHLAHTAWFFETLLLKPYLKGYREFHPLFACLFNSYYDTIGRYHPRPERGVLSRPTVAEVYRYRAFVDEQMLALLADTEHEEYAAISARTVLGLNHEQQHQELLLTDIKYNFSSNPLRPVYRELARPPAIQAKPLQWVEFSAGLESVGFDGDGFAYDNETPRHKVYLNDFRLASRPVTNGEFIEFINDGGYSQAGLWLSDAWKTILQHRWLAPLYWGRQDNVWQTMTLAGMRPVDLNAPVCHVSFYEAAAYARWVGKRLPTEIEWEVASAGWDIDGNLIDKGFLQPSSVTENTPLQQMFGDVWEWTQSPYTPYPGYHQASGPLGEYNGKFMSSQMVLRGGSCVTPNDHIRATYRNFFYPEERWQFSGFRLAEDLS